MISRVLLVEYGEPAASGVASPKKVGGPNNFSLLVSSKKLQYTCLGPPPPIYKTLLNGFAQISGGVWTEVGGPDSPIPPVATPLPAADIYHFITSELKRRNFGDFREHWGHINDIINLLFYFFLWTSFNSGAWYFM